LFTIHFIAGNYNGNFESEIFVDDIILFEN